MDVNILVVDDSAAIRKILIRTLVQASLPINQVFEAADGLEALQIINTTNVRLVLSDINMPNMDGLQLLKQLRNAPNWNEMSVVMITTEGSQTKVLEAVQLGAKGYLRKPFTADAIKEKVLSCLSS